MAESASQSEMTACSVPPRQADARLLREARLLTLAAAIAISLAIYLAITNQQRAAELSARATRVRQISADVSAIVNARQSPRAPLDSVTERGDVLDNVVIAMQQADLEARSLVSTQPQTQRAIPGTSVADIEYRLLFADVPLPGLLQCVAALVPPQGQYHVNGIVLRAADDQKWNADVTIALRTAVSPPGRDGRQSSAAAGPPISQPP